MRRTALFAALILVAACADDRSSPPPTDPGEVIIGLPAIGDLDPPRATSEAAAAILKAACDQLVAVDPESWEPKPGLAASWTIDELGTLMTMRLNEKEFQNGTSVDASAVRESLSRVVRPESSSPYAALLDAVEGFDQVRAGAEQQLSGIRVKGKLELEIEGTRPIRHLPVALSHPALTPVTNPGGAPQPVCAGPYKIEPGAFGSDLRLVSAQKVADLPAISVKGFGTSDEAFDAQRGGSVHISPVPTNRSQEGQAAGRGFVSRSVPGIAYLAFDPASVAEARVRRAISLAIDRLVIIDAAFGDSRGPALRWLSAPNPGTVPEDCEASIRKISDGARAKQLLAEAGVDPAGVKLTLVFDNTRVSPLVAQALQVQIKDAVGISISPDGRDSASFDESFNNRPAGAIWLLQSQVDLPTFEDTFADIFRTGSGQNRVGYSNPALDQVFDRASRTSNEDESRQDYLAAEASVCRDMPGIPLWHDVRHWMINEAEVTFEGRSPLDLLGLPVLRNARPK